MSDESRPLPPKKHVALALLEREPSVFIHLDPRRPGVSVPSGFTRQPELILQVGLNMSIPIPDLEVDDEGISCTLSFNRAPFWCRIPWSAIFALVSEDRRGGVWPEDIPTDLAPERQRGAAPQRPGKKPRPRLAAVASAPEDGERAAAAPDPERGRARGHLRSADLPADEPDAQAEAEPAARAEAEAEQAPAEGEASPPAEGSPARGAGKGKRELPPYLRVIK